MIKYIILLLTILQIKSQCGTLNDPRCQGCEVPEICRLCYESYWNSETKKCEIPKNPIEKCEYYKNENTCLFCDWGYYINSEKKCVKISIKNCLYSEEPDICYSCNNGYQSSDDETSCTTIKCTIDNCFNCQFHEDDDKVYKLFVMNVKIVLLLVIIMAVLLIVKIVVV